MTLTSQLVNPSTRRGTDTVQDHGISLNCKLRQHGIKYLKPQSQDAHSLVFSSWIQFSLRIHALCRIPLNRLGIFYVDLGGDGVALVQRKSQGFLTSDSAFVHFGSIRDTNHFVEPTSTRATTNRLVT